MTKVYTLSKYPEEVIAHAFAKTSRSPGTFQEMVSELTETQSDKFHSKWVLEYGHNSIAEHAMIHLAVEDVSRLAVDALESGRLASYTEQSTRYQTKTAESVFIGKDWSRAFVEDYKQTVKKLFDVYDKINASAKTSGKKLGFVGYDFARFLLPTATKVNVGLTINARSLRRTLCKMLASTHPEIRELADQLTDSAKKVAPSLLRHVKACNTSLRLREMGKNLNLVHGSSCNSEAPISVVCRKFDVNYQDILTDLAYEYGDVPWGQNRWSKAPLEEFLAEIGEHDATPRAFENGLISFEIESDYGSYYDMKRHRMATLHVQEKSFGNSGYVIPGYKILKEIGLLDDYIEAMETVAAIRQKWIHLPESIYLIPNAYRIRYKMTMNPRELMEIIKIRGLNKNGHTSYRFIGLKMLEIANAKHPALFSWLTNNLQNSSDDMLCGYKCSLNNVSK